MPDDSKCENGVPCKPYQVGIKLHITKYGETYYNGGFEYEKLEYHDMVFIEATLLSAIKMLLTGGVYNALYKGDKDIIPKAEAEALKAYLKEKAEGSEV